MAVSENDLVVGPLVPAAGVSLISLDFYFEDEGWLKVYKSGSETPLILDTDYTVTGEGTGSGSITLTTAANGTDAYSVYLAVPLQRSSDLQLRGEFKSEPFNIELDRVWQAMQGLRTRLGRALSVSRTSDVPGPLFSESLAGRSDRVLKFSSDGESLEVGPTETQVENAQGYANEAKAARDKARDWAESPTPPDGPGTKSAKTWASEAETSASDAATSESNAEGAATTATAKANEADGSASTATTQAGIATSAANDASDAASAAASSATTSGQKATAASNSASTATTKANDADQSATAANTAKNQAETARNKAQDWAESPTAPGDPGTKSAKTHAESIRNLTASATTVTNTDPATATYDPNTGNMSFEIPAGPKGDTGVGLGNVPSGTVVGRQTAGTGMGEYLTPSEARSVMGLGTAATTDATDYATAAQGSKADAAIPAPSGLTQGDLFTVDGVGNVVRLAKGTAFQSLQMDAGATKPEWGPPPLGVGQTWQDVTASRANNTLYQNTTAGPIMVAVRSTSSGQFKVSPDGINETVISENIGGYGSFIIPRGMYYRVTFNFSNWAELR